MNKKFGVLGSFNQIKLLRAMRRLNEPIDTSTLTARIALQKKIYFLQRFGEDFGYRFNWYIYGPYSRDLTRDAFALSAMDVAYRASNTELKGLSLNEQRLSRARDFFGEVRNLPDRGTPEYWLELFSSVHFLITKARPPVRTSIELIEVLGQEKPGRFVRDDVNPVMQILKKYHLIPTAFG